MKKQFISMLLAIVLIVSNVIPVFADSSSENIDYTGGTLSSTEINEENKSQEVEVSVELGSSFNVTIPKTITLNGSKGDNYGKANYEVSVSGDLTGTQVVNVVPDSR